MSDTTDMKQSFTDLANSAASGQLMIEDGTAQSCISRCKSYIQDLQQLINDAGTAVHTTAFGNLDSASKFIGKFHDLSINDGPGSGGYVAAVKEHIDVVNAMIDMFNKADQAYKNSDEETQAKLRQAAKSLDTK